MRYKERKFNLIISFSNSKEENIKIIETFHKTYYLFKRICSKNELLEATNNIISSNYLLLSSHFRARISDFFGWGKNDSISNSVVSDDLKEDLETNDKYKD